MERGVDHARLHALGNVRVQSDFAGAAGKRNEFAIADAAIFRVEGMNLEHVLVVPGVVRRCAAVCAPTLYCERMRPVVRISGKRSVVRSSVGTNSVIMNLPLPRTNPPTCITGVPSGAFVVAGPLNAAEAVELFVADAREGGSEPRDFVHDFRGMVVMHGIAKRFGERER